MQDYKEIIKDTINCSINTIADKLTKIIFVQCIVLCASFALIFISIAGFYFIGYTNYPTKEDSHVKENQKMVEENIIQTPQTTETTKIN